MLKGVQYLLGTTLFLSTYITPFLVHIIEYFHRIGKSNIKKNEKSLYLRFPISLIYNFVSSTLSKYALIATTTSSKHPASNGDVK